MCKTQPFIYVSYLHGRSKPIHRRCNSFSSNPNSLAGRCSMFHARELYNGLVSLGNYMASLDKLLLRAACFQEDVLHKQRVCKKASFAQRACVAAEKSNRINFEQLSKSKGKQYISVSRNASLSSPFILPDQASKLWLLFFVPRLACFRVTQPGFLNLLKFLLVLFAILILCFIYFVPPFIP